VRFEAVPAQPSEFFQARNGNRQASAVAAQALQLFRVNMAECHRFDPTSMSRSISKF